MMAAMQQARELSEFVSMPESRARARVVELAPSRRHGGRTWADGMRLEAKSWLLVLKCFERDLQPEEAMLLTGLPRATSYRAFAAVRDALAASDARFADLKLAAEGWSDVDAAVDAAATLSYEDPEQRRGFSRFLRARLRARHGASPRLLAPHILEALVRYEGGGRPLFDRLLSALYREKV